MQFYSTNREAPRTTFRDALQRGQAPDRGLYMPDSVPTLSPADLAALRDKPYADVATRVLRSFVADAFDEATLRALCVEAYNFPVPLEHVHDNVHLLRLDRGPTASFKDFAARLLARWVGALAREDAQRASDVPLTVLVATSGDTGGAVADAFHGVAGVRVVLLFPQEEVSETQRRQMTTLGDNVRALAVDGKFDDCQRLVKQALADADLAHLRLTSANSINIGRLLPQCVYYVYTYLQLCDPLACEPIVFCIPSGNFGNMMGAVLSRKMGLPIERIVVATNANDAALHFVASGEYHKIDPSRKCLSNAMNVGHPSNLARLVDCYGGWIDEQGGLREAPDLERMRRELAFYSISDDDTAATIRRVASEHGCTLEPHGAVGYLALERWRAEHATTAPCVVLETAHPAKFPEIMTPITGVAPEPTERMREQAALAEHAEPMAADYEAFVAALLR